MNIQFTHPYYLLLLPPALAWVDLAGVEERRADQPLAALAGVRAAHGHRARRWCWRWRGCNGSGRWKGMNVFFLLDRSDSIPSPQQEAARDLREPDARRKRRPRTRRGDCLRQRGEHRDRPPTRRWRSTKIQAVVGTERTDIAGAIRLGTAAFPETGQKRLVLMSDGNENIGDAMTRGAGGAAIWA